MGHFWVTMAKYIVTKTFSSLPGVRDENNNVIVKQTDLKTLFTNCRSTINWTLLKKIRSKSNNAEINRFKQIILISDGPGCYLKLSHT